MTERRLAIAAVGVGLAVLAIVLVVLPTRFMSVDEAKYLGIGVNVFAGRGPLTVFDVFFAPHSPVWPIMVVAPHVAFGVDVNASAHAWNVISALAIVALAASIGWRIRPAVGVAAAALLLLFPYFLLLGHTLGLDLPAAALILAYLVVGRVAVDRRSVPIAALAGLAFAVAFLVKEIALPFAPVPFLAGAVRRVPPSSVFRLAAVAMLVGAAGTSWWFVVYAQHTNTVYRLGTPGWTLAPLAIGIVLAGLAGWFSPRLLGERLARATRGTVGVAWITAVVWTLLLIVFFSRTRSSAGEPFLSAAQVARYLRSWLPTLGPILAIAASGAAVALVGRVRGWWSHQQGRGADDAIDELLLATLCGIPLVLLVVSVGELPRHYVAQIAILLVLGAAGWILIIERARSVPVVGKALILVAVVAGAALADLSDVIVAVRRQSWPRTGLVVVLTAAAVVVIFRLQRAAGAMGLAAATVALAVGVVGYGMTVTTFRPSRLDAAKATAVSTTSSWIRANVPKDSTIAFAAYLAYETADTLQDSYRIRQIREEQNLLFDASAPLGFRQQGRTPADDWIAVDVSPNVSGRFYGYRASELRAQLLREQPAIWTVTSPTAGGSSVPILEAFSDARGVRLVSRWSWPSAPGRIDTLVFAIDPGTLSLDASRLHLTQVALGELVDLLAASGPAGRATAARLAQRVAVVPDDTQGRALVARLESLAAR